MATILRWNAFKDATADSFNIYRAITGLTIAFPNSLVAGNQFIFSATSQIKQTVTLSGSTSASLISDINTFAHGLKATLSEDTTKVFIRVTAKREPRLQLFPCTFATSTSQIPRIIVPRKEMTLLTNVVASDSCDPCVPPGYSYADADGDPQDWYRMTSVVAFVESIPTVLQQAVLTPDCFCVVVGRVVNLQNKPIPQARVFMRLLPPGQRTEDSGIIERHLEIETDSYGRFSIPILQKKTVLLSIPSIGYNQVVEVPAQDYVLFRDLVPVNDQLFEQDLSSFYLHEDFEV